MDSKYFHRMVSFAVLLLTLNPANSELICDNEDANLHGLKTSCYVYESRTPRVDIYPQLNTIGPTPIAVAFVRELLDESFVLARENVRIRRCQSTSGLSRDQLPDWINSHNASMVDQKLSTHCFIEVKRDISESFPYEVLHRVTRNTINEPRPGFFTARRVGYVIPDRTSYMVFEHLSSLTDICTVCITWNFDYGQGTLVSSNNLTNYLTQALG